MIFGRGTRPASRQGRWGLCWTPTANRRSGSAPRTPSSNFGRASSLSTPSPSFSPIKWFPLPASASWLAIPPRLEFSSLPPYPFGPNSACSRPEWTPCASWTARHRTLGSCWACRSKLKIKYSLDVIPQTLKDLVLFYTSSVVDQILQTIRSKEIHNYLRRNWSHLLYSYHALRNVAFSLRVTLFTSFLLNLFLLNLLLFLRWLLSRRDLPFAAYRFFWSLWHYRRQWLKFFPFQFFLWEFVEDISELWSEIREVFKNVSSILTVVLSQSPPDDPDEYFHSLVELFDFESVIYVAHNGVPFFF